MQTELIPVESKPITLWDRQPADMVAFASGIAKVLADVIRQRRLFSTIKGKEHVKVEGWTTLGSMLGIVPREVETHEADDGTVTAVIELIRVSDQAVLGRASAICSKEEARWKTADRYAIRSMAITRATGKAYRLGFSWIITLAGYDPTPAEEMPYEPDETKPAQASGDDRREHKPANGKPKAEQPKQEKPAEKKMTAEFTDFCQACKALRSDHPDIWADAKAMSKDIEELSGLSIPALERNCNGEVFGSIVKKLIAKTESKGEPAKTPF